jgi:hypothetical protein
MANTHEITMYRGDSYPLSFTIKNKDTSAAVDLTGGALVMTVNPERDPVDASEVLFQLNGVMDAPATGVATFTPSELDTDLPVGKYYYDIEYTDAAGNVRTIVKSTFAITQDITK